MLFMLPALSQTMNQDREDRRIPLSTNENLKLLTLLPAKIVCVHDATCTILPTWIVIRTVKLR